MINESYYKTEKKSIISLRKTIFLLIITCILLSHNKIRLPEIIVSKDLSYIHRFIYKFFTKADIDSGDHTA